MSYTVGISDHERYAIGLGIDGILWVQCALAAHRFPVVRCEYDYSVVVEPEFLQLCKQSPEFPVHTRNICEIVSCTWGFGKSGVCIWPDIQFIVAHIPVEVIVFFHTVIHTFVRTVRRIVSEHQEERLVSIPLPVCISEELDGLVGLVFYGIFLWVMSDSFRVPVMRVLVDIECTV